MKKKKRVINGKPFLPNTPKSELQKMHKEETVPKAKLRLKAYILRKENKTLLEISAKLGTPYDTIRGWLLRVSDDDLSGIYNKPIPGAPHKLSKDRYDELKKDLVDPPKKHGYRSKIWTRVLVRRHVKKKYGARYSSRGVYNLLHRLDFTCERRGPDAPWFPRMTGVNADGTRSPPAPGSLERLEKSRYQDLKAELLKGPKKQGFNVEDWTIKTVMEHIEKRYGVEYDSRGVYSLLRELGFASTRRGPKATWQIKE